jgi:hypothetical protein
LANATPADEQTIRAEIKRYFYDAGDQGSAARLNSALSVVLRPNVTQRDRQQILNSLDVFTRADPKDYLQTREWTTGAALAVGTILPHAAGETAPGEIAAENASGEAATAVTRSEAWTWGWGRRGQYFDQKMRDGTLPKNFPTIDNFPDGVATSFKSIDLNAATYQAASRLANRLNKYVNDVSDFDGDTYAGKTVYAEEITGRVLGLIIPKGSITKTQRTAIDAVESRAAEMDRPVRLKITEF